MMRALFFATLALFAGCRTSECKDGTLHVEVHFGDAAGKADHLAISVAIAGGAPKMQTVAIPNGDATGGLEIDFPNGYPKDQNAVVTIDATKDGVVIAGRTDTVAIVPGCTHVDFVLEDTTTDLGVGDLASDLGHDLAKVDSAACAMDFGDVCAGKVCESVLDPCGNPVACGGCALFSIEPHLAEPGKTIDLEGVFGSSVMVAFPGGTQVAATVLGKNRAQVSVPSTATRGVLHVTTNGATVGSQSFGLTTYTSHLGAFRTTFAQNDVARPDPELYFLRSRGAMVRIGSYVYDLGGTADTSTGNGQGTIERATVNADGTIGTFVMYPKSLVTARYGHHAIVIGSTLYIIGGHATSSSGSLLVESAPILPNGDLGPFDVAPTNGETTTVDRFNSSALVIGSWLYLFGGTNLDTIERAPIGADGSLGAFVPYSQNLALKTANASAFVVGSTLYIAGGTGLQKIQQSTIDGAGELGSFGVVSSLPSSREGMRPYRIDDRVYLIGGDSSADNSVTTDVLSATITVAGSQTTLSAFQADSTTSILPAGVTNGMLFSTANALYYCGGNTSGSTQATGACMVATNDTSSMVGTFTAASTATTPAGAVVFSAGDYVYIAGGATANVYRAQVTNGSLGAFTAYGSALTQPRFEAMGAVVDNMIYIMDGRMSGSSTSVAPDADVAPIDSLGNVGTFTQASVPVYGTLEMVTPRYDGVTAYMGPYVYVDGGRANGGNVATTREKGMGDITQFTQDSPSGSGTSESSAIVVDNNWYEFTASGSTMIAALSGQTLGNWVTSSGLSSGVAYQHRGTALIGSRVYIAGGFDPTAMSDVRAATYFNVSPSGTLSTGGAIPGFLTSARHSATLVDIGNNLYVVGGGVAVEVAPLQ